MAINRKLDYVILDLIESSQRTIRTAPLNLGAVPGSGGGEGAPPGGFIGWLPQTRVAYDTDELASMAVPSGPTLLDNLNHIRYRMNVLESGASITVVDGNLGYTYLDVDTIVFSGPGIVVTDLGSGNVLVDVSATGSGGGIEEAPIDGNPYSRQDGGWVIASGGTGTPLTVQEYDGSPIVANVDKIIFSGATVIDNGSGDVTVVVTGSGAYHNSLAGLQGGAADDYYHLKGVDYTDLTDAGITRLHIHDKVSSVSQTITTSDQLLFNDVSESNILGHTNVSSFLSFLDTYYLLKTGLSNWSQQGSTPSTPAAGAWKLYFKSDGLYYLGNAGVEIGPLNTLIVEEQDGSPSVADVRKITFSGATVIDNGSGDVTVLVSSGGSGAALTVEEVDGSPSVVSVDKIIFSGATVTDLGSGDVLVSITTSGGTGAALTVQEADGSPIVTNVDKIIFSGASVTDMGSGDVLVTISGLFGSNGAPYSKTYFFDTLDSDITGYDSLVTTVPTSGVSSSVTSITGDTLIKAFASTAVLFNFMEKQTCFVYISFTKVGGTKDVQGFVQLYHRTSGGTETLIGTSNYSNILTNSVLAECILAVDIERTEFSSTDRLVIKVLGHQSGSGTDPSLIFNYGATTFNSLARISFGSNVVTVVESGITLADNTTNDASTSKHGFLKKLSNVATEWMSGLGTWVTPKSRIPILLHANSTTVAASTTSYMAPALTGFLTVNATAFPFAGTIKNLTVRSNGTQPASGAMVVTIQKEVADTTVTLTITAGSTAQTWSDTTHSFTIAAGDRIGIKFANAATAASAPITSVSFELVADTTV